MFCSDGGTTKLEIFTDGGKVGGIERERMKLRILVCYFFKSILQTF